ncbi:cell division control protein 7 [Acrasis kona]|uniref:non-specific serine/threonine protein kinase n=1 Tax=Acrasis kona TaxID=1008807 RepID=A0AAW2ZGW0_9EUKA
MKGSSEGSKHTLNVLSKSFSPKSSASMLPPVSPHKRKFEQVSQTKDNLSFSEYTQHFDMKREVGNGSFSVVYQAIKRVKLESRKPYYCIFKQVQDTSTCSHLKAGKHYALKRITCSQNAVNTMKEVKILYLLRGEQHIVKMEGGVRERDAVTLILDYVAHASFTTYFRCMVVATVRQFMYKLMVALRNVHKHNIVHRDVKPANCLFNPSSNEFVLTDFGLAEHTDNIKKQNRRNVGTRGFRAPELLLESNDYGCAVDVWSAGIILLSILSCRYPIFQSKENEAAVAEIIALFGEEEVKKLAKKLEKKILFFQNVDFDPPVITDVDSVKLLCKNLNSINPDLENYPDSVYDLLFQLLKVDPSERITAEEALNHEFFKQ